MSTMKSLFKILTAACLVAVLVFACDKYDDSAIKDDNSIFYLMAAVWMYIVNTATPYAPYAIDI